jgi:hypothetical protein
MMKNWIEQQPFESRAPKPSCESYEKMLGSAWTRRSRPRSLQISTDFFLKAAASGIVATTRAKISFRCLHERLSRCTNQKKSTQPKPIRLIQIDRARENGNESD